MSVQKVNDQNVADMNHTYKFSLLLDSSAVFAKSVTVTDGGDAAASIANTQMEDGTPRLTGEVGTVGAAAGTNIQTITATFPAATVANTAPTASTHDVVVNATQQDDGDVDNAIYSARITSDAAGPLTVAVSRVGNGNSDAGLPGNNVRLDIELRKRGISL